MTVLVVKLVEQFILLNFSPSPENRFKRMQLPDGTLMETSVFRGRCWVRRACQRSCTTMNLRRAKPVETDQPSEPFPALANGSRRIGLSSISWWGQPFQCGSLQKGLARNGREVYAGNRKAALLVASSLKEQRSTVVATWKWPLLSLSWLVKIRAKRSNICFCANRSRPESLRAKAVLRTA
uniref:(northern house mosquito) hypothetical protein n=1 Tax=Culex pipiens TaxID=7175 RepID=A0A8D8G823_CULPI